MRHVISALMNALALFVPQDDKVGGDGAGARNGSAFWLPRWLASGETGY